jgi:hypothetical protein
MPKDKKGLLYDDGDGNIILVTIDEEGIVRYVDEEERDRHHKLVLLTTCEKSFGELPLKIRYKLMAMDKLGSHCCKCKTENLNVLQFHHTDGRPESHSKRIKMYKDVIEKEDHGIVLLCVECHQFEHGAPDYNELMYDWWQVKHAKEEVDYNLIRGGVG